MTGDELLRAFAERRDERAFAQIVERYLNVVFVTARRQVAGDEHLAEDVTQAVFIMLARKAPALKRGAVLAGWLVTAARLAGKAALRAKLRRSRREQQVAMNQHQVLDNPSDPAAQVDEELNDALARLADLDRTAVTLRFLQNKPVREVAETMGISEDAAAKRLSRAVAKLREIFRRRGIHLTATALAATLSAQAQASATAVPATLTAQAVAETALQATRAGAGTAAAEIADEALAATAGASWSAAKVLMLVTLLIAGVAGTGLFAYSVVHTTPSPRVAPVAPARSVATPVKVGVYVSLNTAIRKGSSVKHDWGNLEILGELQNDAAVHLYPLIEPGSDHDAQVAAILDRSFPSRPPIDVTDVESLRQVDVIVASAVCYPAEEALAAIEAAVRGGRGLVVRQCLGGDGNGYLRPVVCRLRLLSEAAPDAIRPRGHTRDGAAVVNTHPLLGSLSGQVGKAISVQPYGGYGKLADGAVPLIAMMSVGDIVFDGGDKAVEEVAGYGVYPLAVGQLGNGRIVSAGFGDDQVPEALDLATGRRFTARAILWAARRDLGNVEIGGVR